MVTDAQLFQDVTAAFKHSPFLQHARLSLHVQDGIVTISGRLKSLAERQAVERAVRRVSGVTRLVLDIRAAVILPPAVTDTLEATQKDTSRKEFG